MAGKIKCRVVYRLAGGVARSKVVDCPDILHDANAFFEFLEDESRDALGWWDELMDVEWHFGTGQPCDRNLIASYGRRMLGLYGYEGIMFADGEACR